MEDPMKRAGLLWIGVAAITIVSSACSKANNTSPPSSEPPPGRLENAPVGTGGAGANLKSDDDFVRDVAMKNMAGLELSRLARDKTANPNIRVYAETVIDDDGSAGDTLKNIVSGQPIEWPAQLDDKHRKIAEELMRKQGDDFDREYVKAMIEGHEDLAAKLESRLDVQSLAAWKTAAAGRADRKAMPDPRLALSDVQVRPDKSDSAVTTKINQWAADTYPVAQKHLDTARTLESAAKKRSTN
jgi:putative membrane protein